MENEKLDWIKVQLTRSCNLKCTFCSQADFRENKTIDVNLFIKNVLEVAKPRLLIITGGEPLTKLDELYKLLEYCQNNDIETGIFSNATLVNEEIATKLKKYDVNWVRVSINGFKAEIHEKSYPVGTYDLLVKGIKNLKDAGIYVKCRTTVTKNNQNYIEDLIKFIASLGIKELDFRPYLELGDCNPHQANSLSTEELIKNCAKLINYKKKYKENIQIKLLPNWFDFIYSDIIDDDEKFRNDIFNSLLTPYKMKTHQTVYIGANFVNYKHIDWARVQAYKERLCPISPQNILSYFLYHSFDDNGTRYLKDRLTLLAKSDTYWLCIDSTNLETELNKLDQNTLAELYMLNNVYVDKAVKIVDWGDIKVPKYDKSKMWALTSKEQEEILGKNWPIEFRK